jgi:hypothetical protein
MTDDNASASSGAGAGTGSGAAVPVDIHQKLLALVERSQKLMSHAWMIRTFVKHSDEVEDFPELNEMARTIFDVFRAVETQVNDPVTYFRTVRKKLSRLQAAAEQFEKDAWHASTHTNFQQAAIASRFLGEQLLELVTAAELLMPRPAPPKITMPGARPALPPAESVAEKSSATGGTNGETSGGRDQKETEQTSS